MHRVTKHCGIVLKVSGGRRFFVVGSRHVAVRAEMRSWPYSAEEVTALRQENLLDLPDTCAELIKAMRAKGIAIEDGMND
jgi:hypothetical protein